MDRERLGLWRLNKFTWLSLAFVLAYLLVAQQQGLLTAPTRVAWVLFAVAVADGAGRTLLGYLRGHTLQGGWSTFFNALDITLISAAIGITGGIHSDLWLLYFVVLIFESLFAAPRSSYLLNLYIGLTYVAVTLLVRASALHPDPLPIYLRLLGTRLFFQVLISGLAWRVSADAHARDRDLMLLREQMAAGEERARIAREIHDSLGHSLVGAILRLELCARLIERTPAEAEAILKEEITEIRNAWNEGRDLAFHLRPWDVESPGESLPETLQRHISRFAERTGMVVELKAEGNNWPLRPIAAFALTRIVQEALTNAVRHAQATRLDVSLTHGPGRSTVCVISDNGIGFGAETREGVGLQAIRDRVAGLGGTLDVHNAPGQGAVLSVTLPE